jgi:hypothetical protein
MLKTPVALLVFNRPDTTERVFAEIAKAKPSKLFIIADGPRAGHPTDAERCAQTRAVVERVDWDCELFKHYADVNLGCGFRVATGIGWVFEHVEEAIILEDDCLPHPTFFRFCEELLEKYRYNDRIMMVAGRNSVDIFTPYSYCFTYNHSNWGWATWRRAWKYHDIEIKAWPRLRNTGWLMSILENPRAVEYWQGIFDKMHAIADHPTTWDYQWTFAVWAQNGLAITPKVNLIGNIGFGENATSTKSLNDSRANATVTAVAFPLVHPPQVLRDRETDRAVFSRMVAEWFRPDSRSWIRRKLSQWIPPPLKDRIRRAALLA